VNAGHDVVIVDDLSNSHPRVLPALAQLLASACLLQDRLADRRLQCLFEACPESDAVVHFAAYLSVSESVVIL
jgi:UDP-glucose 4-epimerase